MPAYSVPQAAGILGVSDDTIRRWAETGRLHLQRGINNRLYVDGAELAAVAEQHAAPPARRDRAVASSARNRFTGIVTKVTRDTVMAQVEIQAGPYRVVSLVSREACDDLSLEPGVAVVAAVKSTNVIVERHSF